jgi:hypothetical protein
MPSFLSWLDHSEHEKRKMLDVINLFRARDTRDELGIGTVREAFSNMLFPGTSTIQTRPERSTFFLSRGFIWILREERFRIDMGCYFSRYSPIRWKTVKR